VGNESAKDALRAFVSERDWSQFHTPSNLAKSISIEAAELLECFQWSDQADVTRIKEELADVLTYCFLMAESLGVGPEELILEKLEQTRAKYPTEKASGKSTKYDQL
jgi:NTP pyrophosphatase (non-canonical NTP hydrolase)